MYENSVIFLFRPKCDPKEDFGLTFNKTSKFQDCVYIEHDWWAIQIMPIGFKPNFNGGSM